jgi:hypothetical protein
MKKYFLSLACILSVSFSLIAQDQSDSKSNRITPYAEVHYNLGCGISNPISFAAGIQQPITNKLAVLYDINYWSTPYENDCCDTYSKGKYSAFISSVKMTWYAGKRKERGFFMGAGLGYIFAKDRGTEQSYLFNPASEKVLDTTVVHGSWDFNSFAPTLHWGLGFRIFHLPVKLVNEIYFARTTIGWGPVSATTGIRVGFRKID